MVDGGKNRKHPVAVLHKTSMVLRAGGHALFLRVIRNFPNGGGQHGQDGLEGPKACVALIKPGCNIVAKQGDSRLRRDIDMPLDPADLRLHIRAAEIRTRGVDRHVQTQFPGMVGRRQANSSGEDEVLSSSTSSAAGTPISWILSRTSKWSIAPLPMSLAKLYVLIQVFICASRTLKA